MRHYMKNFKNKSYSNKKIMIKRRIPDEDKQKGTNIEISINEVFNFLIFWLYLS